jgi:hypothetical protein
VSANEGVARTSNVGTPITSLTAMIPSVLHRSKEVMFLLPDVGVENEWEKGGGKKRSNERTAALRAHVQVNPSTPN